MISRKISQSLTNASWIRSMFEKGEQLRSIYGEDKVFDFSLGNPDPEPPKQVKDVLKKLILENKPGMHRYMNNAGYVDVRQKIADKINSETSLKLTHEHVIMTCGAGGGLNVVLKTLLDPGEEVIVFSPFFVEYGFYIDNHGGKMVIVPTDPSNFEPDIAKLEQAITNKTKAIIINSPNNPSGVVYSEEKLKSIAQLLEAKEKEFNSSIYVISDEPYSMLVYDGVKVPNILTVFKSGIIVDSYSKSLALPGERIGYIAVSNFIKDVDQLIGGLVFSNRTLGFVNAPALFQKVVGESLGATVDADIYKERRDILYNYLVKLGFSCVKPQGAFYLFPKSPIEDDVEFVKIALKYNILLVPGKGFFYPGYFRLSYCVSLKTIKNSLPAFEKLAKEFF
jgi:aspartate aminotransferase